LLRADGLDCAAATIKWALARRGLLLPVNLSAERG
jgi:hypothetical protein